MLVGDGGSETAFYIYQAHEIHSGIVTPLMDTCLVMRVCFKYLWDNDGRS